MLHAPAEVKQQDLEFSVDEKKERVVIVDI